MQKDINVSEGIDIFDGIPLPQEVRKTSQGEDRKKLINQALSLFAYGITDFEASRAMGISHNVYSNLMSEARSMYEASNSVDAVVRAMQEGKIRAEEVIPEGYILKLDGLKFQEREIYDEIINNPGVTYELIGAKFNLAPSSMKFRAMQIFKKLGISSRNHMVIVDNALKIKEAVNSSEDNLNIEVA